MIHHLNLNLEIKAIHEREFEGHAAVFGNIDLGGDIILPGAFKRSLSRHRKQGTMPPMFWMHNPELVPGVWKKMQEDETGLAVRGELVDTQLGNEARTLLQKKAVRGMSIGYKSVDVGFDNDGNRILKEIDLWEASLVSLAMNPLARVDAIKTRLSQEGEYVPTTREFELHLRDAGCSKNVARTICGRLFSEEPGGMPVGTGGNRRWDAGDDEEERQLLDTIEKSTAFLVGEAFRKR